MGSGEEYLDGLLAALNDDSNKDSDEDSKEEIEQIKMDDPNKALDADEIAALFAQANIDATTGDSLVEEEMINEPMEETLIEEAIEETKEPALEVSGDPNKALSPDEIAALFAQANIDAITGDTITDESIQEDVSIDDMLADLLTEETDEEIDEEQRLDDLLSANEQEDEFQEELEEIEIDMNDPKQMELLFGLSERPEREKKQELTQEDENAILESMGEENPDLHEINEILNKLDNNELIDEGIEESVLVEFDETDFESEADPWLEELLGSSGTKQEKEKKKTKRKKKGFSLFGKKKKEQLQEEAVNEESESKEQEIPGKEIEDTQESISEEEVTDILSAFAADDSSIPFDLFADNMNEDEETEDGIDLIALVEADQKKAKKDKKTDNSKEKKGLFAKLLDVLTEEIPEEEEKEEKKDKNDKKKKKRKDKKGEKAPVTDADDNEGILEELDAEEQSDKKKKKKVKKEKKKKIKPVEDFVDQGKKLPIKMVVRIFVLCFSIMILILATTHFIPKIASVAGARNAFYKKDYRTAYEEMLGKELSDADQRLFEKAKMITWIDHKVEAHDSYKEIGLLVEALDSLLSGLVYIDTMQAKLEEYDALSEANEKKAEILQILQLEYQLTQEDADMINGLDSYNYTLRLEKITGKLSWKNGIHEKLKEVEESKVAENATEKEAGGTKEEEMKPTEDVLPEEEIE